MTISLNTLELTLQNLRSSYTLRQDASPLIPILKKNLSFLKDYAKWIQQNSHNLQPQLHELVYDLTQHRHSLSENEAIISYFYRSIVIASWYPNIQIKGSDGQEGLLIPTVLFFDCLSESQKDLLLLKEPPVETTFLSYLSPISPAFFSYFSENTIASWLLKIAFCMQIQNFLSSTRLRDELFFCIQPSEAEMLDFFKNPFHHLLPPLFCLELTEYCIAKKMASGVKAYSKQFCQSASTIIQWDPSFFFDHCFFKSWQEPSLNPFFTKQLALHLVQDGCLPKWRSALSKTPLYLSFGSSNLSDFRILALLEPFSITFDTCLLGNAEWDLLKTLSSVEQISFLNTPVLIEKFGKLPAFLKKLTITGKQDSGLIGFFKSLPPTLSALTLCNTFLNVDDLRLSSRNFHEIEELILCAAYSLDGVCGGFLLNLKKLKWLVLDKTPISDAIADYLPWRIEIISFVRCSRITARILGLLRQNCRKLAAINVTHTLIKSTDVDVDSPFFVEGCDEEDNHWRLPSSVNLKRS